MCGRYKMSTDGEKVWEFFDIHGDTVKLPFHFNIAPTQNVAVIRTPHRLEFLRWGIKIPNPKAGGFNVRVESLARRCFSGVARARVLKNRVQP